MIKIIIGSLVMLLANVAAWGADTAAGRVVFRQQCVVCHTAEPGDEGGAQGPALNRVADRPSGSTTNFAYTSALRDARINWDAPNLNRFLASPTTVVPGTAMVIAVEDQAARENLVAYLQSVNNIAPSDAAVAATKDMAEWRKDKPGRVYRITVDGLTKPFDTPTARNPPSLIARPADARLKLPDGFEVEVFATNLQGPRRMIVAANKDVLVTETRGGRVSLLRKAEDGAVTATVFAQGLQQPFGLAFYPNANKPQWIYVAETNRIVRYRYSIGDTQASGTPEVVVAKLPASRGHFTRDLAFSADGKQLYVSVGSATNVAVEMPKKNADEIKQWEAQHGVGAAWDVEADRATVLVYEVNGKQPGKTFATGLRNCVSVTVHPTTHDVWCTVNERDLLGDDLVPDYSTRVKQNGFYGWPWYYLGKHEDPRLQGERPDLRDKVITPDVLFQAHSAALHLTFYDATQGVAAFPKDYVGDAIVAFHGSWNRSFRTGYKLVRVRMKQGVATGEYEDFMTGFIVDDGNVWGRPVATTIWNDGSLLVSDDGANQIYRVYYARSSNKGANPP